MPRTADRLLVVGRERERAVLDGCLDEVFAGVGQTVLIRGAAGIGKTTLVRSLAGVAESRQATVLCGHCYDVSSTRPYGPWIELADRYRPPAGQPALPVPFAGGGLGAGDTQQGFFAAIVQALTLSGEVKPMVLVLEDLQWSDTASLDLVSHLCRQISGLRVMLVVTYRSDEVGRRHPLSQLVPSLVHDGGARRLHVRPLPDEAISSIIVARYALAPGDQRRLAGHLVARAEGNPLYVREVLATLEDQGVLSPDGEEWTLGDLSGVGVPGLVRQLIDNRLGQLDESTQELLEIASVIGAAVPVEVWRGASGVDEERLELAIDQALGAWLLENTEVSGVLRFSHALVREALYERVIVTRRQMWHRRVAEVLMELGRPDPDLMAHHCQLAGDGRAVEWLQQAGERAQRSHALVVAAERFEAAAGLMRGDPSVDAARGWLLYRTGRLLRFAQGSRALPYLEEAERIGLAAGDLVLAAYALNDRGFVRCFVGDPQRGMAEMEAGIRALESLPTDHAPRGSQLAAWIGDGSSPARADPAPDHDVGVSLRRGEQVFWLGAAGQYRQALEKGQALIDQLNGPGAGHGPELDANPWTGIGFAQAALGSPMAAAQSFQKARQGFAANGHWVTVANLVLEELETVCLAYRTSDLDERQRLAGIGEDAYRRAAGSTYEDFHAAVRVPLLLLHGAWGDARVVLEDLVAVPGASQLYLRYALATLERHQGRRRQAWVHVNAALPKGLTAEPGDYLFGEAVDLFGVAAALALDETNTETAAAWLDMQSRWLEWSGTLRRRCEHHTTWARYHQITGELSSAAGHAAAAVAAGRDPLQPLALQAALRTAGEVALADGRLDQARQHLDEAAAVGASCAAVFELALTEVSQAELLAAEGWGAEAGSLLEEARAVLVGLGAAPALARADALAAELGSPAARPPLPGDLSPREVDVLRLLAAGRTNKQIAAELVMSVRTAERHVANLYNKIHATSRAEATTFAHRHHLT